MSFPRNSTIKSWSVWVFNSCFLNTNPASLVINIARLGVMFHGWCFYCLLGIWILWLMDWYCAGDHDILACVMHGTSLKGRSLKYINFLDRSMTNMLDLENEPGIWKACFEIWGQTWWISTSSLQIFVLLFLVQTCSVLTEHSSIGRNPRKVAMRYDSLNYNVTKYTRCSLTIYYQSTLGNWISMFSFVLW